MASAAPHLNTYPRVSRKTFEIVLWSGLVICTLAVAFRCYVRIHVFRRLQADDCVTIFAWTLLLATALIWSIIIDDVYEISLINSGAKLPDKGFVSVFEKFSRGTAAAIIMFYLGLWTIKLNFPILFYRLGNQITIYRRAWWIVTVFTICVGLSTIGTIQYRCLLSPINQIQQHCGGSSIKYQSVVLKLNCALDVFTDALIVLFPMAILRHVRISLRRKLALGIVFSLVVITMTVSIIRATVVVRAHSRGSVVEVTSLYLWSFIESAVALLVACLASFRTLFAKQGQVAEANEADDRERAERKAAGGIRSTAIRARWRHFNQSLFEVTREDKTKQSTIEDMKTSDREESVSMRCSQKTSDSCDSLPKLNMHNLVLDNTSRV